MSYPAGGKTEIYRCMVAKTFAVFEGVPQGIYLNLITSGKLNDYLADIEEQAQERFERVVEQMKQAQGITEQLKADDTLEWIGRMNNIQACAREIVDNDIIYQ